MSGPLHFYRLPAPLLSFPSVSESRGLGRMEDAPQDFVVLGVFCARFPPREANML